MLRWRAWTPTQKGGKSASLISVTYTPGWDRTNGLLLRRQTLYPLSYGRVCVEKSAEPDIPPAHIIARLFVFDKRAETRNRTGNGAPDKAIYHSLLVSTTGIPHILLQKRK